ncbi:MAG: response regulator [Pseudomonadales bacterium]|nr:response regulator [Pseudomonadales bacterium]
MNILVVDDDIEYGKLMSKALSNKFDTQTAGSGKEALTIIAEGTFDIFLLDIEMPEISGYEVCDIIRNSELNKDSTVVFISGHDSIEDRMTAYQKGADDFVAKPFELRELLAKLERAREYTQEKQKLIALNQSSREVAFNSMTEVSEYGNLVHFAQNVIRCNSIDDLFNEAFKLFTQLDLTTTIEFRGDVLERRSHNHRPVSPIETNLFELLNGVGRLYHFDSRTMINDQDVSILIKNMPLDDEARYGRLKDMLAFAVEILQSRLNGLHQKNLVLNALQFSKALNLFIEQNFCGEKCTINTSLATLNDVLGNLQEIFHVLGLTEEQENTLQSMIDTVINEMVQVTELLETLEPISSRVSEGLDKVHQS